jgi:hypothetical protein
MQHALNIIQVVAFLSAFIALASRLFVASRPFWSRLPAFYQAFLPALVPALATFAQGLTGVKSWGDLSVQFMVCAAMLLPGLPSNRSAAPMQVGKPVTGTPSAGDVAVTAAMNDGTAKPPSKFPPASKPPTFGGMGPMGGMLVMCLVLSLTGCAWFKGSFWPNVSHCAPSPASLVADVADILSAGSNYESALEQLALVKGKDLVLCAVEAFVNSIGKKVGASPEEMAAHARGKAFLAKHPVSQ